MQLIINADDFGLTKSINKGILEGIKKGAITSVSLMINKEYSNHAVNLIKEEKINCVGIHLNIEKEKPTLTGYKTIIDSENNERSVEVYEYTNISKVKRELEEQIIKFKMKGLVPTHISVVDSIYNDSILLSAVLELCKKYYLPFRAINGHIKKLCSFKNIKTVNACYINFYGDNVNIDTIKNIIEKHKGKNESIEIVCHPGEIDMTTRRITKYLKREEELQVLKQCIDENVFEGINLISYKEVN